MASITAEIHRYGEMFITAGIIIAAWSEPPFTTGIADITATAAIMVTGYITVTEDITETTATMAIPSRIRPDVRRIIRLNAEAGLAVFYASYSAAAGVTKDGGTDLCSDWTAGAAGPRHSGRRPSEVIGHTEIDDRPSCTTKLNFRLARPQVSMDAL